MKKIKIFLAVMMAMMMTIGTISAFAASDAVKAAQEKVNSITSEMESTQKAYSEKSAELETLKASLDSAKAATETAKSEMETAQNAYLAKAASAVTIKQGELDSAKNAEVISEYESKVAAVEAMETKNEESQSEIDALLEEKTLDDLKGELEDMNLTIMNLEAALEDEYTPEDFKPQMREELEEVTAAADELQAKISRIEELQEDIASNNELIENINGWLNNHKEDYEFRKQRIEDLEALIEELTAAVDGTYDEVVEAMNSDLIKPYLGSEFNGELAELQKTADEKVAAYEAAKAAEEDLAEKVAAAEAEVKALNDKLVETKDALIKAEAELKKLQEEEANEEDEDANTATSYEFKEGERVVLHVPGDFDEFKGIEDENGEISKSNYTAEKGSVIITFTEEYSKALAAGTHEFKVNFASSSLPVTVKISKLEETKDDSAEGGEDNKADETKTDESKTEEQKTEEQPKEDEAAKPEDSSKPVDEKKDETSGTEQKDESKVEESKVDETKKDDSVKAEETKSEETKTEETKTEAKDGKSVPATGDAANIAGMLAAFIGSGAGLGGVVVFRKKKNR